MPARGTALVVVAACLTSAGLSGSVHAGQAARSPAPTPAHSAVSAFQGEDAEAFLSAARIVRVRAIGRGVTRPQRVTLELDGVTHDAVFKTIDSQRHGLTRFSNGRFALGLTDSWRAEVAAYRVDRMIGLGMVPATVERTVHGTQGSLQWWVDAEMSEADRVERGVRVPDVDAWARQRFDLYLFDELIDNVDRHLNNLLVTHAFEIRLIDHSRSFNDRRTLRHPERLRRFSRSLLEALEALDFVRLRAEVGRQVSDVRIRGLLERRDCLLKLARDRIAQYGETAVVYR